MAVTNLDKFKEIEKNMEQFQLLKEEYLKSLLARHEYMNEYRSEYRRLINTVQTIKKSLHNKIEKIEEYKVLIKVVKKQIEARIEYLREEEAKSLYEDYNCQIKALKEYINMLYVGVERDYLIDMQNYLIKEQVKSAELQILIDDYSSDQENKRDIESLLGLIKSAQNEYLSSFKIYRKACEESEDVYESFNDIFDVLIEFGYDSESDELSEALPDIEETRKLRPDPQPLLDIIKPVKSAGLEYFQSKNRNSNAYDYNIIFARETAYTRRALLEDREYIGTRNAFERLEKAFNDLSEYMYERYYQLGGTPINFHGHDDRK